MRWTRPNEGAEFVLVHSMGKVGSYSIFMSLEKALKRWMRRPRYRVLHTHQLNRYTIDTFKTRVDHLPGHIQHSEEFLSSEQRGPVKIITPVREPMARNISAFFENIGHYGLGMGLDRVPASTLHEAFINRYDHRVPSTWFQRQLAEVFDVDVFAEPLDFSSGGEIIRQGDVELLLLRIEDDHHQREEAIRRFLHLRSFTLQRLNVGTDKAYGDAYLRFKAGFRPHPDFVDGLYETRFATQFYTASELDRFRRQWRQ